MSQLNQAANPLSTAFYAAGPTVSVTANDLESTHIETGTQGDCVRVENHSSSWVYIAWDGGVAVADERCIAMAPGSIEIFGIPVGTESFAALMAFGGAPGIVRFTCGWGI